ncbi:AGC/NDR protein kinase [Coprinopsis marcescibilis]|uniref:non-specific serine/threonine protein kinase n=1 Tax=Coprinopsis marcescibilis TaxID=230819 RepID=A0A5C3KNN1_COPMA|nr:AGC/NDR protein kinase [Coprinopsis marcescibilis]
MPHISGLPSKSTATTPGSPTKQVSGLPDQKQSYYRDVHMDTAKGIPTAGSYADIRMGTAKAFTSNLDDIKMETARGTSGGATTIRQSKFQPWETALLSSSEVKRKSTVAQLYFLDYYFQTLGYIASRKERRAAFDKDTADRNLSSAERTKEFKSYCGRERVILRKRRTKLKVDQFHIIAQVGQGGYGEVYLARKQDSGEVCALKKMRKRTLFKMDEIRHVLVERDILTATKTPWLVRLLYAFQDPEHVYLAMEYVPGGDFRTLLNNSGVLKEEHARFYISEMFAAVNELHKLGYIHRDLKPENFLVDGTGHVKLTDFGLATGALNPKRIESLKIKLDKVKDTELVHRSTMERRSIYRSIRAQEPRYADSIVGSPDYMAPEVLRGRSYTYSVDYWSLGCILFEFLAGFPPFSGSTPEETWANLKNWTHVLRRPEYDRPEDLIFNLTDIAWDAVVRLIASSSVRFATLQQVRDHVFFKGVKWDDLRAVRAPFVPALDSELDTGYYDDFTSPDDMAKYAEVKEKQRNVDQVKEKEESFDRGVWVGFTFGKNGPGVGARPNFDGYDDGSLATIF